MRVCHVWERFWPVEIGGLERYILLLCTYLAKKAAIDFSLITGRTKLLLVTKNIQKYEDARFLKVYRLGPNPVDLLNGVCMYVLGYTPKLLEKLKFKGLFREASKSAIAQSADIFHIHGIWSDLEYINLGISLSKRFGKPLVVTLHGGYIGNPLHGGMPLEEPNIRRILVNDVSAITTYSKEVLGTLKRMGLSKKSFLISNFVDTSHFKHSINTQPHETTLIYVGRLEPVQTPDLIIYAFEKVRKQLPNSKLIMVGYGRLFDYLKLLTKDLGLEESVSMVGKQTDVRKFLWNSDIFVATNFGYIATLEAWAAGLTVVAPKFGILKEVISHGENGLLFEPNNVEDLASNLIRVIKDKPLRESLALNGTKSAQDYDIRVVAPEMSRIYNKLLCLEKNYEF